MSLSFVLSACDATNEYPYVNTDVTDFGDGSTSYAEVVSLKTNGVENPIGLDSTPEFSWQMNSNRIGAEQTAYQITLSDGKKEVWDSGSVKSNVSSVMLPESVKLEAKTEYTWKLSVVDETGATLSGSSSFTTGLKDTSMSAWTDGSKVAQFIGSENPSLDADTLDRFAISSEFSFSDSVPQRIGFIFGANDFRLEKATYNKYLIGGENYILLEIECESDGSLSALNVIRKGYSKSDKDGKIVYSCDLNIPAASAHSIKICEETGALSSVKIDGKECLSSSLRLNPEESSDANSLFPTLNDIGFMSDGGKCVFGDYKISNYLDKEYANYTPAVLFSSDINATYSIFKNLDGVSVNGNLISVDDSFAVADPSYGGATYLRREFSLNKQIKSAYLFASARGVYEYYINGERVKNEKEDYFNPGSTDYAYSMEYSMYDVSEYLTNGANAMGAVASSGWWCDSMSYVYTNRNYWGENYGVISMLEVTYTDGTKDIIVTDSDTWQYSNSGPIRYSGFFHGETYDATIEKSFSGWSESGFDSDGWSTACEVVPRPDVPSSPEMTGSVGTSVQVYEELEGSYVSKETRGDGDSRQSVYIFDVGENMAGIPRVELKGTAVGTEMVIRYGETLYPALDDDNEYNYGELEGLVMNENYRTARSIDRYITKGGNEIYEPSFTYHGFRYIEISFPDLSEEESDKLIKNIKVSGLVLSSVSSINAEYESSNSLADRLFENVIRSTLSNHISVPTDCPQRDERQAWTGDAAVFADTAVYMSDMANIYGKFSDMMYFSSLTSAARSVSGTVPAYDRNFSTVEYDDTSSATTSCGLCWAQGYIRAGYAVYKQTGSLSIISRHYENYKKMLSGYGNKFKKGYSYIPNITADYGDWLSLEDSPTALVEALTYANCLSIMGDIALALGKTDDYNNFTEKFEGFKKEFNDKILSYDGTVTYNGKVVDTQTVYAMIICYNLADGETLDNVILKYEAKCADLNVKTGFQGTPILLNALSKSGKKELAYSVFESEDYAGWLYPVTQGATSVWERWNSYTVEDGFGGNNGMNSFNHYSLGSVASWMMSTQIGINSGDEAGYYSFSLNPTVGGTYTYAKGSYQSNIGKIISSWTADGNGNMLSYSCIVPANSNATLYLPVTEEQIDGLRLTAGMSFVGFSQYNGEKVAEFVLAAGGYEFSVESGTLTAKILSGYTAS